jgi:hypothetical protein
VLLASHVVQVARPAVAVAGESREQGRNERGIVRQRALVGHDSMSLKEGDGDVLKKFIDRLRLRFDAVSRAWHRVKRSVPQSGTLSADKVSAYNQYVFLPACSSQPLNRHAFLRTDDLPRAYPHTNESVVSVIASTSGSSIAS